jgi:hypothetical protein
MQHSLENPRADGALPRRFLRPCQVAEVYGFTLKFLAHARARGNGPSFFKPSRRLVLYAVDDIERWLEAQRRTSTSDDGK